MGCWPLHSRCAQGQPLALRINSSFSAAELAADPLSHALFIGIGWQAFKPSLGVLHSVRGWRLCTCACVHGAERQAAAPSPAGC